MHSLTRRRVLGLGLASTAAIGARSLVGPAMATTPDLIGSWSAPFDLGAVAIHLAVMRNDQLLYFSWVEGNPKVDQTSLVKTYDLRGSTDERPLSSVVELGYQRDLFCSGLNALPDGRILVSGGHDHTTGERGDFYGWNATDIYDPVTRRFTTGPPLTAKRWYPTSISMPGGTTLIMGGGEKQDDPSPTVESYDPVTDTVRTLPSSATKNLSLYPRMHLLRNGTLIKTGPARVSLYFRPATNSWHTGPAMRFGTRLVGNSVLLPGSTKILAFGGRPTATSPPTATSELLDTTAATPAWRSTGSMTFARAHACGVLLPDGKVLAIGGGASGNFTGPVKTAELFDPATERWTPVAVQSAQRMYHSTAALLPDGRVISAGSESGPLSHSAEIYSPPYLFKGGRPTITSAPDVVRYGQSITVTADGPVASWVLMRPGVVTHQIDTEQRAVPLSPSLNGQHLAPRNAREAPPGYYMLFAVTSGGVPSRATWVRVLA